MKRRICFPAVFAALFFSASFFAAEKCQAEPIRIFRSEFEELGIGRTTIVEDFQGFGELGQQPDSFAIANGTVTGTRPAVIIPDDSVPKTGCSGGIKCWGARNGDRSSLFVLRVGNEK